MYNNFKAAPNLGNRGKINENGFFPLRMVTPHVFEILSDFRIEIEKQPFDGFQRYFAILSFLFQIRRTYYHVHNKTHF